MMMQNTVCPVATEKPAAAESGPRVPVDAAVAPQCSGRVDVCKAYCRELLA